VKLLNVETVANLGKWWQNQK